MNINKRLRKINRNLQEVAMEISMSDKPKERKGDYARIITTVDQKSKKESGF